MNPVDIRHQRLDNQRLSRPTLAKPGDVVEWLCAVQAQDFAAAKWALGSRMRTATDDVIERAFNEGSILRTHVLRPTWHFVRPADIRWMLALTAPRIRAGLAGRHRRLGLDEKTFQRSGAAIAKALEGRAQLTREELRAVLEDAGIPDLGIERMTHIMARAELDEIVISGRRRGKQLTYALFDARVPHAETLDRDKALEELASRYFHSRGPATVQDFAKWAGLTVADARKGLEAVQAKLHHEVVEGTMYWFPTPSRRFGAAARTARPASSTAHLLSLYDEHLQLQGSERHRRCETCQEPLAQWRRGRPRHRRRRANRRHLQAHADGEGGRDRDAFLRTIHEGPEAGGRGGGSPLW